ncbi:hypothetical protein BDZ89DRAFT_1064846 [Hymenopellis radicata]|nr:hypothetical protein BDZ89DRAFT_1064846 [Hymenopellis radicata]
MVLEKTNPFNPNLSLAIQSGAGRALTISLPHSMALSVEELTRDFSQFRGLVNVTISADHLILRYQSVLKALRTVCALEAGTHRLPDKYVGGRVSFLPMRGAPQTLPITISEGYDSENWKMASRWVEKRWKPPAVVVNRKSIWKIRRKRWVPPSDPPGVE